MIFASVIDTGSISISHIEAESRHFFWIVYGLIIVGAMVLANSRQHRNRDIEKVATNRMLGLIRLQYPALMVPSLLFTEA